MSVRYVEYIENDGGSYFDLGVVPNQDTRIVCEFSYTSNGFVFGSEIGWLNKSFCCHTTLATYNVAGTNFSLSTSDKHTVDFNKNVMSVNGVVQREFDYAAFSSGYTLYLFSDNRGGTANETMKGQISAFQYYDNGTLKFDYRPCVDDNDVACLYEEVSKTYKYGVGTFTAGPLLAVPAVDFGTVCRMPLRIGEVVSPVNYVEWIKSDGNAYFDTEVKAKSTLRVKMKAQMLDNSISTPFLFGARNSSTDSAFCFFYHTSASAWKADYQTSNNRYTFDTTAVPKTGELEIDFNKNVWTVNGVSKTFTAATFTSNYNLVLFANNTAGTIADQCPALIEYCQIYDNDVLIKNYRAAVDPDGVACFYDKVSKTYEYGVGTLTAGASISGGDTTPTGYTITISGDLNSSYGYATINDTKYTSAQTVTIEAGTSISVYVRAVNTSEARSYVKLNGTQVQTGNGTYTFVPSGNTTIVFTRIASDVTYFACDITTSSSGGSSGGGGGSDNTPEIPINITGSGDTNHCYALINGTKYTTAQTVTAKAGDEITLHVYSSGSYSADVKINGTKVLQFSNDEQSYVWTVPSDCAGATIKLYVDSMRGYSNIAITTE